MSKKPSLRFKKYSDDWNECSLGSCGVFKSNGVDKLCSKDEIPVNLLNYMDVYNKREINNKNTNKLMHVTAKKKQIEENNLKLGDVLFTPTSETAEDIGHSMVIEEDLKDTVYSYHLMRYRPNENEFYLTYPNHAFEINKVRNQMKLQAQGVQRFVLGKNQFENIEITKPTLQEQKEISMFLDNIDDLLVQKQKERDKNKILKKSLLNKLFVYKENDKPLLSLNKKSTWSKYVLGENSVITTGGTPSTSIKEYWNSKEIPWLSSGEVHKKRITYTDQAISKLGLQNSSAKWVKENSILIALAGQGKTRGTVAINEIPLTTNQSIAGITLNNKLDTEFVYQNLESRYAELRELSAGDGGRGGLNKAMIQSIEVYAPEKKEQERIGKLLKNIDLLISNQQAEIIKLKNIKQSLLNRMFV